MAYPTLINNGWISVPWAWLTRGDNGEENDAAISFEGGCQAVMKIAINYGDLAMAVNNIMGVHKTDYSTTPPNLSRQPAVQHPIFRGLRATRITSIKGRKFIGKNLNPASGNYPVYQWWHLTILFTMPHYNVVDDGTLDRIFPPNAGLRQEAGRYQEILVEPASEIIARNQGDWIWAEGTGPPQPTIGATFPAPYGQALLKPDLVFTWRMVPAFGLFDQKGKPTNLFKAVWKVNQNTFFNYAPGTLLLQPPRIRPVEDPLNAIVLQNDYPGLATLLYDVDLPFKLFDPPNGGATHGHNLAPWSDGMWYLINSKTGAQTVFGSADYPSTIYAMN